MTVKVRDGINMQATRGQDSYGGGVALGVRRAAGDFILGFMGPGHLKGILSPCITVMGRVKAPGKSLPNKMKTVAHNT